MAVNIKKDFGNTRSRKPDLITLVYGKVPPQAPELEEAVLGAIMLEKDKLEEVVAILKSEEYFYVDANQKIYTAILDLYTAQQPIDLLLVSEALRKNSELELVGGDYYLAKLTMGVVSSAHVEAHAYVIAEKYLQRRLIHIAGSVVGDAYEDGTDVFELLERTQRELYEVQMHSAKQEVSHISGTVMEVMLDADEKREANTEFTGVPTGSSDMDACTGGWQESDLIIIAARPAVGKTAFALNLGYNAAVAKQPVAIFSLEMKKAQIVKRMLAMASGVEHSKIKFPNRQTPEETVHLAKTAAELGQLPIYIDDTAGISISELKSKVRRLKQKKGIKMVIIDYLQLMTGDGVKSDKREQEISMISRQLKGLAMELSIPVIALCQINRAVESRAVRTYKLSDLRESGAIEQDADLVMFLHVPSSEDMKDKNNVSLHTAGVFIEKHRSGECRKIPYVFDKSIQKWSEFGKQGFTFFNSGPAGTNHADFQHTSQSNINSGSSDDLPF